MNRVLTWVLLAALLLALCTAGAAVAFADQAGGIDLAAAFAAGDFTLTSGSFIDPEAKYEVYWGGSDAAVPLSPAEMDGFMEDMHFLSASPDGGTYVFGSKKYMTFFTLSGATFREIAFTEARGVEDQYGRLEALREYQGFYASPTSGEL